MNENSGQPTVEYILGYTEKDMAYAYEAGITYGMMMNNGIADKNFTFKTFLELYNKSKKTIK